MEDVDVKINPLLFGGAVRADMVWWFTISKGVTSRARG